MAGFKYDIVTLIELVESKPCIWDKTLDTNKNKIIRDESWQEIFQYLEDRYEELSQEEKKKTGEMIMAKWTNIRDAFFRSLRTKSGQGSKRSYMYSEHLQFLLKIARKDDTDGNYRQIESDHDSTAVEEDVESTSARSLCSPEPTSQTQTSSKKPKRHLDDIEREILTELKKGNASHHPRSDQETLLLSFLPYIRDMNETELMDFQMETLTTIKKIKERRISNHPLFQPQYVYVNIPQNSPTMSHSDSYQNSPQTFDCQSPPPSN